MGDERRWLCQFELEDGIVTATLALLATTWLPELTLHAPFRPFLPPSVLPFVPFQRPLQHAPPLLPAAYARPLSETPRAPAKAVAAAAAAAVAPCLPADCHNELITASFMSPCRMHLHHPLRMTHQHMCCWAVRA